MVCGFVDGPGQLNHSRVLVVLEVVDVTPDSGGRQVVSDPLVLALVHVRRGNLHDHRPDGRVLGNLEPTAIGCSDCFCTMLSK